MGSIVCVASTSIYPHKRRIHTHQAPPKGGEAARSGVVGGGDGVAPGQPQQELDSGHVEEDDDLCGAFGEINGRELRGEGGACVWKEVGNPRAQKHKNNPGAALEPPPLPLPLPLPPPTTTIRAIQYRGGGRATHRAEEGGEGEGEEGKKGQGDAQEIGEGHHAWKGVGCWRVEGSGV